MQFIKDHPIAAVSSTAVGGAVGYGVSHHFLDFETPYALGAGAATGAASFFATKFVYDSASEITKPFKEAAAAAGDIADNVKAGITSATTSIKDTVDDLDKFKNDTGHQIDYTLGLEDESLDLEHWAKNGSPQQKQWATQAILLQKKLDATTNIWQRDAINKELAVLLKQLRDSTNNDYDPAWDPDFARNSDNPEKLAEQTADGRIPSVISMIENSGKSPLEQQGYKTKTSVYDAEMILEEQEKKGLNTGVPEGQRAAGPTKEQQKADEIGRDIFKNKRW